MSRNKPQIGARELMAPERLAYPVALGVTLLLVACVGEADGDKPTNQQQEELAEAICEMRVECCGEFYDDSNKDTCRATQVSVVGAYFNRVETAVDRGDAEYDAGEFDACASALSDASCSEWIALESGDWPTACRELVRGSLSDGSGCEDHFDCLSGWCDEQGVSGTAGACQARGDEGERCGASDEGCKVGLHCKQTADSDYICAATAEPGGACSQGSDCDSNACLDGLCVAQCMANWAAWPNSPASR